MKIININAPSPPPFSDSGNTQKQNYALASVLLSNAAFTASLLGSTTQHSSTSIAAVGSVGSARSLGAASVAAPAPVGSVGDDPNTKIDYSMEALYDIAQIHLMILAANPGGIPSGSWVNPSDQALLLQYAQDLLNMKGKCNSAISNVITTLTQDFTLNAAGQVTAVSTSGFFFDLTDPPGTAPHGGSHGGSAMNDILNNFLSNPSINFKQYFVLPQGNTYNPSATPPPNGSLGLLYFSVFWVSFLANGNTNKFTGTQISGDSFFGSGGPTSFTTLLPYYAAMALYQSDVSGGPLPPGLSPPIDKSPVNIQLALLGQLNTFLRYLPSPQVIENFNGQWTSPPPNYTAMYGNFQQVEIDLASPIASLTMPPLSWMTGPGGTQTSISADFNGKPVPFGTPFTDQEAYFFFTSGTVTPAFSNWWF